MVRLDHEDRHVRVFRRALRQCIRERSLSVRAGAGPGVAESPRHHPPAQSLAAVAQPDALPWQARVGRPDQPGHRRASDISLAHSAPGADRLLEGRGRYSGGRRRVSGDSQPRGGCRERGGGGWRIALPTTPSNTRRTCCGTFRARLATRETAALCKACGPSRAGRGWPTIRFRAICITTRS